MDLRLYGRVIYRFRYVVIAGFILACALTFLTVFRVGSGGISYRQQQTYRATEILFLTQPGDPVVTTGDIPDLSGYSEIYVQFANGDQVRQRVAGTGLLRFGDYQASPVFGTTPDPLPSIAINGFAHTPALAKRIAHIAANAVRSNLTDKQIAADVPEKKRVLLSTINAPTKAVVAEGRKLTVPIVIFLSVLIVTLGLVFILENLKPRPAPRRSREREPEFGDDNDVGGGRQRRSSGETHARSGLDLDDTPTETGPNGGTEERAPTAQPATRRRRE
jgi:hypothetical protein